MGDALRIFCRSGSGGGHRWLRLEQTLAILSRKKLAKCRVLYAQDTFEDFWQNAAAADLIVTCGSLDRFQTDAMIAFMEQGKPFVYDADDNPTNVCPTNVMYRLFGLEEVKIVAGDEPFMLWEDGRNGFNLKQNRENAAAYYRALRASNALSTTTDYLADVLKRFNKRIYVHPNVFDFSTVWKRRVRTKRDGKVRIMYQGGSSHEADLIQVLPALMEIADRYPQAVFQFYGTVRGRAAEFLPEDRIETYTWDPDYKLFALNMALRGPDIGIAPLSLHPSFVEFNRCKSSLKWLDYAAIGVPCVCQWETPYQQVVKFGPEWSDQDWTGVLADTPEDWVTALGMLIEHEDARLTIGENAYAEAREHWDAEKWAPIFLKHYEEVALGNRDPVHTEN